MLEAQWTLSPCASSHDYEACLDNFQFFCRYWNAPYRACMIYGHSRFMLYSKALYIKAILL